VGSQVTPLQPVQGALVLEPTDGAAPLPRISTLAAPELALPGDWQPAISAQGSSISLPSPEGATIVIPTAPEPRESDADASILVPSGAAAGSSPARSWDTNPSGPSLEPTTTEPSASAHPAREATEVIGETVDIATPADTNPGEAEELMVSDMAADSLPPAVPPKAPLGLHAAPVSQAPAPAPAPGSDKPSEDAYGRGISQLLKPIGQVGIKITPPADRFHPDIAEKDEVPRLPRASELFAQEPAQVHGAGGIRTRPWHEQIALWEAPGLAHHGLYFEEVNLERYGYSFGIAQPVVSAAHFFGRLPALPYLITNRPPYHCVYTLGHYRPGSCAPLAWNLVPFDPLAAAVQGGVVTGLVFLIP
jgi:hypothetical protein